MPSLLARIELFLAFFLSHLAFTWYKATFWVDCSAVFGPFWGSTVSLIVEFRNFSLVVLCMKKNHVSINERSFLTILLRIIDRRWREFIWMLAWVQSCMRIKKGMFWVHFLRFCWWWLLTVLFQFRFSPFPSHFLTRSIPIGFRKGVKKNDKHMACHHHPLCVFWPRTTMVVDRGCCGGHIFKS